MAILYGTQSNGETLPVQVNSFGQLVAQGLDGAKGEKGDKGDQGEQGEQGLQGPPGVGVEVVKSTWDPVLEIESDGEVIVDVANKEGFTWDFGGFTLFTFTYATSSVVVTNPRGKPRIKGFPVVKSGTWYNASQYMGFTNRTSFFNTNGHVLPKLSNQGNFLTFQHVVDGKGENLITTDITEHSSSSTQLSAVFMGVRATEAEILEQLKRTDQEGPNS